LLKNYRIFIKEVSHMAFKAKISEKEDVAIVELAGSLDSLSVDDLNITFNKVKKTGKQNVLLTMKKLKFINSRSIGSFISLNRWTKDTGGSLIIAEVPAKIMETFKLMRLETLIPFYNSSSDALKDFQEDH